MLRDRDQITMRKISASLLAVPGEFLISWEKL
jgi:hypothetical protein